MSRYVSEIMTSTLTNMYMATHSLTGQNGVKGPNATHVNKLPIDKKYVQDLIGMYSRTLISLCDANMFLNPCDNVNLHI